MSVPQDLCTSARRASWRRAGPIFAGNSPETELAPALSPRWTVPAVRRNLIRSSRASFEPLEGVLASGVVGSLRLECRCLAWAHRSSACTPSKFTVASTLSALRTVHSCERFARGSWAAEDHCQHSPRSLDAGATLSTQWILHGRVLGLLRGSGKSGDKPLKAYLAVSKFKAVGHLCSVLCILINCYSLVPVP